MNAVERHPVLQPREIERVVVSHPSEVAERLEAEQPIIFERAIDSWDAAGKWSPQYFADSFPDYPLRLYDFTRQDAIPSTFPEFLAYLEHGVRGGELAQTDRPLYLAWNADVIASHPELAADFDFEPFFGGRLGVIHTGFWMGAGESHTPLHTDIDSYNLHAVLHGSKNFLLFPPDDDTNLYPSNVYEWSTVFSSVDVRNPDLERFPRVTEAAGHSGDVHAGELIYIPIGWWHAVSCLEPTTSLNAWLFDKRLLWSLKLYRDLGKRALHAMGLYARGRCTCHGQLEF